MTSKTVFVAMAIIAAAISGCQESDNPTGNQHSTESEWTQPATAGSTRQGPVTPPEENTHKAEEAADSGLDIKVGVGENGVNVDVGDDGVNVDVGDGDVNVDVGRGGVNVDLDQDGVKVDVGETADGVAGPNDHGKKAE